MVGRIEGRVKEKRVPKFKKRYKWRFIGDILDGRRRRHRREFEIDYWTGLNDRNERDDSLDHR